MPDQKLRKQISVFAASLVIGIVLQYYSSSEAVSFTQGSLQNLHELNKQFEVLSITSIAEEAPKEARFGSLLLNSVLHKPSENTETSSKRLLFKMKKDPDDINSIYAINLPEKAGNLEEIAKKYNYSIREFDFIEPDYEIEIAEEEEFAEILATPEDIARFKQVKEIKKKQIDTSKSWPTVAVIDTGTDIIHQELRKNRWKNSNEIDRNKRDDDSNRFVDDSYGWDFVNNSSRSYVDESGHGTHVSGIITKTNGSKVMPIKVIENKKGSMSNVIRGIKYATDQGADIINFSIGSQKDSKALQTAIKYAEKKGIILVAAAGNNGDESKYYPAAYDSVISIGATDENDKILKRSNHGKWVDVYAPGESIVSTLPGHKYGYKSGTSQSAAAVTAKIVDIKTNYPSLTRSSIQKILKRSFTTQ